jgi:hypothetical protein
MRLSRDHMVLSLSSVFMGRWFDDERPAHPSVSLYESRALALYSITPK